LLISLFISLQIFAQQNLVANPSFEEVSGQLKCYLYDVGKFPITNWRSASEGSIDAFSMQLSSTCIMYPLNDTFGGIKPRTGKNYLGFSNIFNDGKDYREYLRGKLITPLEVGALYKIEFYVCLSNFSSAAMNNIGVAFINDKTKTFANVGPIPIKPDVNYSGKPITKRDKWTLLTFDFVATTPNLDAFIIGNFFSSEATDFKILSEQLPIEAYVLIDDISVNKIDVSFDLPSRICSGEKVDFPLKTTNDIVGFWTPEFNPYQSQTYTFTSQFENSKLEIKQDIIVLNDISFELITYCENFEFFVEAKFNPNESREVKSFNWKLNNIKLNSNQSKINLSEYKKLLRDKNEIELEITNENGCKQIQKNLFNGTSLCKIQNELTPNNDGVADFFDLNSFGGVDLKIFNRFGTVIYENPKYFNTWKGNGIDSKLLPVGNYYYQIETNRGEQITGWIQLTY